MSPWDSGCSTPLVGYEKDGQARRWMPAQVGLRSQEQETEMEMAESASTHANQLSDKLAMCRTIESGCTGSFQYSMLFFHSGQGRAMSPWHDVPLHVPDSELLNFVCLTPQGCWGEYDTAGDKPLIPPRLRRSQNLPAHFTNWSPSWSFGFLPQTWAGRKILDTHASSCSGIRRREPLEVVVLGSRLSFIGQVYPVKLLGAFALISSSGEPSWKLLAVDVDDDKLAASDSLAEQWESTLSCEEEIQKWLSTCHSDSPGGKEAKDGIVNGGRPLGKDWALRVLDEAHANWQFMVTEGNARANRRLPPGLVRPRTAEEFESVWTQFTEPADKDACIPLCRPSEPMQVHLDGMRGHPASIAATGDCVGMIQTRPAPDIQRTDLRNGHPGRLIRLEKGDKPKEPSVTLTPRGAKKALWSWGSVSWSLQPWKEKESNLRPKGSAAVETPIATPTDMAGLGRTRSFDLGRSERCAQSRGASSALGKPGHHLVPRCRPDSGRSSPKEGCESLCSPPGGSGSHYSRATSSSRPPGWTHRDRPLEQRASTGESLPLRNAVKEEEAARQDRSAPLGPSLALSHPDPQQTSRDSWRTGGPGGGGGAGTGAGRGSRAAPPTSGGSDPRRSGGSGSASVAESEEASIRVLVRGSSALEAEEVSLPRRGVQTGFGDACGEDDDVVLANEYVSNPRAEQREGRGRDTDCSAAPRRTEWVPPPPLELPESPREPRRFWEEDDARDLQESPSGSDFGGDLYGDLYPAPAPPAAAPESPTLLERSRKKESRVAVKPSQGREKRVQFIIGDAPSPPQVRHQPSFGLPKKSSLKPGVERGRAPSDAQRPRNQAHAGSTMNVSYSVMSGSTVWEPFGTGGKEAAQRRSPKKPPLLSIPADSADSEVEDFNKPLALLPDAEPPLARPLDWESDSADSSWSDGPSPASTLDFAERKSARSGYARQASSIARKPAPLPLKLSDAFAWQASQPGMGAQGSLKVAKETPPEAPVARAHGRTAMVMRSQGRTERRREMEKWKVLNQTRRPIAELR